MDIKTLKDLKNVIRLCRAEGVRTFTVAGISIELNEKPVKYQVPRKEKTSQPEAIYLTNVDETIKIPQLDIPTDELSQEELLFYSANSEQGSSL